MPNSDTIASFGDMYDDSPYSEIDNVDGTASDSSEGTNKKTPKIEMKLEDMCEEVNLAEFLSKPQLQHMGSELLQWFNEDMDCCEKMQMNLKNEIDLAMQIVEHRTFPFEGASNMKFPLVTVAVLQYMSRAREALYNNQRLIEASPPSGADRRDPKVYEACKAVEKDIAYELLALDSEWDKDMGKCLMVQGTLGNAYKKVYFDAVRKKITSELRFPDKLIFNCEATSLYKSGRISDIMDYTSNDCFSKHATGEWLEISDYANSDIEEELTQAEETINQKHGITRGSKTPISPNQFIEMYIDYDLDGDGYMEPLIVTFKRSNGFIVRIVANFHEDDIIRTKSGRLQRIEKEVQFIAYELIPSPTGSPYAFGFSRLLYSINTSVNDGINTMLNTAKWGGVASGFMSAKLSAQIGGRNRFQQGEFKILKDVNMDIGKHIWTYPQPKIDPDLFRLIAYLVDYADRVSGSTGVRTGQNPGQNTKVGTIETLVSEGATIFNGIYSDTHTSFGMEIRAYFKLKKRYFNELIRTVAQQEIATEESYKLVKDIFPAASKQYPSLADRNKMLSMGASLVSAYPQAHNIGAWLMDTWESLSPDDAKKYVLLDAKSPQGIPQAPNPKVQLEEMKQKTKQQHDQQEGQFKQQKIQIDQALAQSDIERNKVEMMKIVEELHDEDMGHAIALMNTIIGMKKHKMSVKADVFKHVTGNVDKSEDKHEE